MTVQELYITSAHKLFSTFLDGVAAPQDTKKQTELLFLSLIKHLGKNSNLTVSPEHIEKISQEISVSKDSGALLTQFIQKFSLSQTEVLLTTYLLALNDTDCSPATIKNYRSDINQFLHFTNYSELSQTLTKQKVLEFIHAQRELQLSGATIKRKLVSLAQFGLWLESTGAVSVNSYSWLVKLSHATPEFAPVKEKTTQGAQKRLRLSLMGIAHGLNAKMGEHSTNKSQEHSEQIKQNLRSIQAGLQKKSDSFISRYANLAMMVLFLVSFAYFGYQQFIVSPEKPLAFPTTLTRPTRTLSFQGRLTDTAQNPVTSATNFRFKLYDSGPSTAGGTQLWDSGTCSVTPDQDGIFSTGLGSDCGSEIASSVFSENANVWLQVQVGAEILSPRQSIKSVAYALNSETLQGFPPADPATANTVVVMNNSGEVVLGGATPKLKASSTSLTLEGTTLNLQTAGGSNGNIVLDPDGLGQIIAKDYIAAPGATLSATYAGGTALTLKAGPSATADIMKWQTSVGGGLGVISASGNIGIGTTSTRATLDVAGDASTSGSLVFRTSTSTIDVLNGQRLDFNTSPGGDAGLAAKMTILNNGNVGIGTTAPGTLLDVTGTTGVTSVNSTTGTNWAYTSWNNTGGFLRVGKENSTGGGLASGSSPYAGVINSQGAYPLQFGTNTAVRMTIDGTGNVGVGTTVPSQSLHIANSMRLTGGFYDSANSPGASGYILKSTGSATQWVDGNSLFDIGWFDNTANALHPRAEYAGVADFVLGSNATASAKFALMNISAGTPTATMSGNFAIASPLGNNPANTLTSFDGGTLNLRTSVGGDVGATSRMFIANNGLIGIGTTAPSQVLDVNGDLRVRGNDITDSADATRVTLGATTTLTNTTTTLSGTTTLTASSLATLTTAASLNMSATTGLTLGDNATLNGSDIADGDLTLQGTSHATRTSSYVLLQPNGGNVGIGTTGPASKLDVQSADNTGGTNIASFYANNRTQAVGIGYQDIRQQTAGIQLNVNAGTTGVLYLGNTSTGGVNIAAGGGNVTLPGTGVWNSSGSVGIGTTNPASFKLQVTGSVGPTTTATYDLGSNSLRWNNIYGTTIYQGANQVCDTSGNCSNAGLWQNNQQAFHPRNEFAQVADILVGSTATASADFRVTGLGNGTTDLAGYTYGRRFIDIDSTGYYVEPGNTTTSGLFAGNVGVGTTTASQQLTITGSLLANNAASRIAVGSAGYLSRVGIYSTPTFTDSSTAVYGINSSVTVNNSNTSYNGYYGSLAIGSGATIDTAYGMRVTNPTGSGSLTNNYGVYVDSLTKGSTNYAIYTAGSTPSYFGGNLGVGTTSINNRIELPDHVAATGGIGIGSDVDLYRSAADALSIGSGDSLAVGGTTVITSTRFVQTANGTAAGPAHTFTSDATSGMFLPSAGNLGLSSNGGERIRIDNAGNVGINTTNPASFKLQVTGSVGPTTTATYDLGSNSLRWNNIYGTTIYQGANQVCDTSGNCTTSGLWERTNNVYHPRNEWGSVVDIVAGGTSTASADFRVTGLGNGTTDLAGYTYGRRFIDIDSTGYYVEPGNTTTSGLFAGNVGIGTTTTSGALATIESTGTQLKLNYSAAVNTTLSTDSSGYLNLNSTGNRINLGAGTYYLSEAATASNLHSASLNRSSGTGYTSPDIYGVTNGLVVGGTSAGGGTIALNTSGGATPTMYLSGSNVGIGTTNLSSYKLDVSGDIRSTGNVYANDKIITSRYGYAGTYSPTEVQGIWSIGDTYQIDTGADTFGTLYGMGYAYNQNGGSPFASQHQIVFTNNGVINAAIGLTNGTGYFAGNVGIGTTNPASFKLQVTGSVGPTTTATYDLGSNSLRWNNIYGTTIYQGANQVCDTSGNCSNAGLWQNNQQAFHPRNEFAQVADILVGSTATASADFRVTGLGNGTTDLAGYTYGRRFIDIDSTGYYVEPGNTTTSGLFAGNVGVGTTGPGAKLDIYQGAVKLSLATADTQDYYLGYGTNNNIRWDTSYGTLINSSANTTINIDADNNDADARFFRIQKNSGNSGGGTSLLEVLENGSVGIGTTVPTQVLDVNGDLRVRGNDITDSADATRVTLGATTTLTNTTTTLSGTTTLTASSLATLTTSSALALGGATSLTFTADNATIYGSDVANGDITIHGTSNATRTSSYVLLQPTAGNVAIGTTVPTQVLDVNGDLRVRGNDITDSADATRVTLGATTTLTNTTTTLSGTTTLTASSLSTLTTSSALALGGATSLTFTADNATINGSDIADGDLTLQGTSHATRTTSYVLLQPTAGSVGIGNSAPTQALHITGGLRVTGGYYDSANSDGSSGYILTSTGGPGTSWMNPESLLDTGWWDNTLNVLHPRNEYGSVADLTIGGTSTASAEFRVTGNGNGGTNLPGYVYAKRYLDIDDTNYYVEPANTGTAGLFAGSVGIGTTNPGTYKLYVANGTGSNVAATVDVGYTAASVNFGAVDAYRSGSSTVGDGISYLFSALDSGSARQEYAGIAGQIEANTAGTEKGRIAFLTTDNGSTRQEKMRLTSVGSLGIGTTVPTKSLDINGDLRVRGNDITDSGDATRISLGATTTLTNTTTTLSGTTTLTASSLATLTTSSALALGGATSLTFTADNATIYGSDVANGDITIHGTSNATRTSSYVLLQPTAGNVAIGTTVPTQVLDVNGDLRVRGNDITDSADATRVTLGATTTLTNTTTTLSGTTTLTASSLSTLTTSSALALGGATSLTFTADNATINGSDIADGDLTLQGTSHATRTTSYVLLQPTAGSVGIGNSAPTQALHITGGLRVTGGYYDSANSDGSSGYILTSTGGPGTSWMNPESLLDTGWWDNTLNVLHPRNEYGSVADLTIGGTSTASAEFRVTGNGNGGTNLPGYVYAKRYLDIDDTNYYVEPANTGTAGLFAGSVGIGTTSAVNSKLHLEGVDYDNSSLKFNNTAASNTDVWRIGERVTSTSYTYLGISLNDAAGSSDLLAIANNGSVGIGTTVPTKSLDINGDLRVRGNDITDSGDATRISLGATTTLTNTTTTLSGTTALTASSLATFTTAATLAMNSTSTLNATSLATFTTSSALALGGATSLTFTADNATINGSDVANGNLTLQGTSNATRTTSYLLLQPNGGNVGVGTTTPASKLEIVGGDLTVHKIKLDESFDYDDGIYFAPQAYFEAGSTTAPFSMNIDGFTTVNDTTVPFSKVAESSSYDQLYSDFIPVQAGETIYGEIYVRRETGATGTAGTVYYGIARYDKDKLPIATNNGNHYFVASGSTPPSNSTWTKYSASVALPTTHTPYNGSDGGPVRYVKVVILMNYNAGTIPTKWGGVILRRVQPYRDSGIVAFNGNVGIGNIAPGSYKLNVTGSTISTDYYSGDGTLGATAVVNGLTFKDGLYTSGTISLASIDHGTLAGLLDDDHTQYALLAGRAGGQSLSGGNAANDDLTLQGTTNATRTTSYVNLQPNGGSVGIGTTAPTALLEVHGTGSLPFRLHNETNGAEVAQRFRAKTSAAANVHGDIVMVPGAAADQGYIGFRMPYNASIPGLILNHSGNVGIGTTGPNTKFTVYKDDGVTAGEHWLADFSRGAASSAALYLGYYADGAAVTSTHIRSANNFPLTLGTTTTNRAMTILDNGNVGIGTTVPTRILDINGDLRVRGNDITDSGDATRISLGATTTLTNTTTTLSGTTTLTASSLATLTTSSALALGGATSLTFTADNATIYGSDVANGNLTLHGTSNATRTTSYVLLQPTAGNVGVGTTAPGAVLDVVGNGKFTSVIGTADDVRTGLGHYDSTAQAAGVGGQIVLGYKYTDAGAYTEGAIIKMYKENSTTGQYGSGLKFQVRNHGAALSTKMTLDPSGNVGIGTTAPTTKLDVAGGAYVRGALVVGANSNLGDFVQFNDTFDGATVNTSNWTVTGAATQNNNIAVTGAGAWTTRGLTSTQSYRRSNSLTLIADITPTSSASPTFTGMIGFSSSATMDYTNMPHAIYFNSGNLHVYENSANRGVMGTYTTGNTYRIKIVVNNTGAIYFISGNGGDTWTKLYDGTANNIVNTPLYFRLTVNNAAATATVDNVVINNGWDIFSNSQLVGKDLTVGGKMTATDYYSGDGTQGATATVNGLTFKDGLYTSGTISLASIDHGTLAGLLDDDHTQYALLAGRAGGQSLSGGTAANDDLTLQGTTNATRTTSYVLLQPTAGNVGIGTTVPTQVLDVNGDLRVRGNDITDSADATRVTLGATTTLTNTTTTLSGTTTLTASSLATLTTAASLNMSATTGLTLGDNATLNGSDIADGDLTLQGTSHATRTSSYVLLQPTAGSVGIGTTVPTQVLDVNGDLRVRGNDITDSADATRVTLGATTTLTNTTTTLSGTTTLTASSLATLTTAASLNMSATTGLTLGDNATLNGSDIADGDLTLQGTSHATRTSSYVLLQPTAGSVGIGTVTPGYSLHVRRTTSGSLAHFENTDTGTGPSGLTVALGNTSSGTLAFGVTTGGTSRFSVKADGNVGVGTTSPSRKLTVVGTTFAYEGTAASRKDLSTDGYYDNPVHEFHFYSSTPTANPTDGTIYGMKVLSNVSQAGTGVINNRAFYCEAAGGDTNTCGGNVGWTNHSDARVKRDINPIQQPLSKLLKLQGVTFYRADDGSTNRQVGFIAQDVLPHLPEVVYYDAQSDRYSLEYGAFSALIVEAVKEQQSLISALSTKLDAQSLSFAETGEVLIVGQNGNYQVTPANASPLQNIIAGAQAVLGKIRSGIIYTKELFVTDRANVANLDAGTITTQNATVTGSLSANEAIVETLSTETLSVAGSLTASGTSQLGALIADSATISGELVVQELVVTGSTRLAQIEAQQAQLESVKATTAELFDATVSGTLYAENIADLDAKIASAIQQPSFIDLLTGNEPAPPPAANPISVYDPVIAAGYTPINPSFFAENEGINLAAGDVILDSTALFVRKYLEVNGVAYVTQALGIGESLTVGAGTTITDGIIAYTGATPESTVLQIQPSGQGRIELLAGLLKLENGVATINGDLTIAGKTTTQTLLTNLIQPTDFGNPFQVQVAGVSTESGEIRKSRFEIINELGTPVATISAEGKANFAGGIGVGGESLTVTSTATSSSVTTVAQKTSGKVTIPAGTTEVIIESENISDSSLIYVTPVGSTQNQVLYVKSQTAENTQTPEKEGKFVVGFDAVVNADVNFNWWIVN